MTLKANQFWIMVFTLTFFTILVGCGEKTSGVEQTDSGDSPVTATAEEKYPDDNIRFIVPSSAGGGFDTATRQLQPYFEKVLGTNFAIENHPGGNTAIGTTLLTRAEADGYTIMMQGTPHLQFSTFDDDVEYDFEDLYPIGSLTFDPGVIRVRDDAPWQNLTELIEYARENGPGSLTASVSFLASNNFLALKQLEEATGVEFNIVPFGGGAEARNAVLGGQVDFTHAGAFNSLSVSEGTRVIGVQFSSNVWPDITDNAKTFNEQLGTNIPDNFSTYGLFVKAEMVTENPERYKKLVDAYKEALEDEEFKTMLEGLDELEKIRYIEPKEYHEINLKEFEELKNVKHLFENE